MGPVIWSAIGGFAAFLLGVSADVVLPIAGIALATFSVRRSTPEQQTPRHSEPAPRAVRRERKPA